jgi:hypothetical protein
MKATPSYYRDRSNSFPQPLRQGVESIISDGKSLRPLTLPLSPMRLCRHMKIQPRWEEGGVPLTAPTLSLPVRSV